MPQAWAGKAAWTVLDTAWGDGRYFLDTWQAWRDDTQRPGMLHYVGIAAPPAAFVTDHPLAVELLQACYALLPGFQRITLDQGRVSLTLCIGELQPMLAEQSFVADAVRVGAPAPLWDKWAVKLLARRCQRGTHLQAELPHTAAEAFAQAGFQINSPMAASGFTGVFNPRWTIATSRQGTPAQRTLPGRCAVVGAGLSGASVARALALRGWQVTVLDQHAAPAGGASGLPAGLVVPHVSADDNPRSRMSRSGTRLMLQHARSLLQQGQDWAPTGVMECREDETALAPADTLPHFGTWVQAGTSHVQASNPWNAGMPNPATSLWHPFAAWIKPAQLVRAWLNGPGIRFQGSAAVHHLESMGDHWVLLDAQGIELAQAELVVFANAMACATLVKSLSEAAAVGPDVRDKLRNLQALHGTMSLGTRMESDALPPVPVNGHGSFLPHVPTESGAQWLAGATFETDIAALDDVAAQHQANFSKLKQLLPAVAEVLAPAFAQGRVNHWRGTRCVTHDRLPLVGPLSLAEEPSLWLCTGMGARGLSFAALCAELLAARLGAEPLPLEASLARSLDVHRTRRMRSR